MAIDTKKARDSLFGGVSRKEMHPVPSTTPKSPTINLPEKDPDPEQLNDRLDVGRSQLVPKYQTFDKVTALLTTEQKDGLDRVAKRIMKQRANVIKGHNKERITANTIIRALIDNFLEFEGSIENDVISSESDVCEWIKKMFK